MPSLTPDQLVHFNESKQSSLIGSLILILCLANFSVAVRIIAQIRTARRVFPEDYFIIFALVGAILANMRLYES